MSRRILESGGFFRAVLSVTAGLLVAAAIMWASGYDVVAAYRALWSGATGLMSGPKRGPTDIEYGLGKTVAHLSLFSLAQSLAKVTPLLLAGLSVAISLRAGLFNIGAQGQMILGALAAAVVGEMGKTASATAGGPPIDGSSPFLHVPLTLAAGVLMGAAWGGLSGLLKAKRGVHEVISTIMFNYIAVNLATYLVTHNLKDPNPRNMSPQTGQMAASSWLAPLVPGSNLTAGIFLALAAAFALSYLIRRTPLGYEIRAVGAGPQAARAAGIPVDRTLIVTMALAGGLAGLAGALEVMGVHHRYVSGVAANYGFDGIAVALLGGLSSSGAVAGAFFFGFLANGAIGMQSMTDVPDSIGIIVQAVVILFVGARYWRKKTVPVLIAAISDSDEREDDDDEWR